MHVMIATFNYSLSDADLRATAETLAPHFADIPGCFEKTWLLDVATSTSGGVYKFRDRASVEAYLASDLWKGVESTPQFTNLTVRIYEAMERPTGVTHGLPAEAARV
jgi:hypothetical protein